MHGRDKNGAIASLSSVAKLRYRDSQDGISNTFSIVPKSLGATEEDRVENLVTMMDGYFTKGAHHLNVNVLNREMSLRCHGTSGKISATHHPCFRLCRKLREVEPRTSIGSYQP